MTKWSVVPLKSVRVHRATVHSVTNQKGNTALVCRCGWVHVCTPRVLASKAAEIFEAHVENT